MTARPGLRGTLLDLPEAAEEAGRALAAAGLGERASVRPGSFFDPLPAGADLYLLTWVLHDWNDDEALRILRRGGGLQRGDPHCREPGHRGPPRRRGRRDGPPAPGALRRPGTHRHTATGGTVPHRAARRRVSPRF
ncbi:methyltransferase [Streptomyces sp. NPDC050164]|uniref:methyltransferase n=1 Tax=Streptomyces sp. NPDC050164 TaxID=3365605 RepID=UPI0037A0A014